MKGMRYYQIQLERPSLNWKPPSRLRVHSAYVPPTFRLRSAYVPAGCTWPLQSPTSMHERSPSLVFHEKRSGSCRNSFVVVAGSLPREKCILPNRLKLHIALLQSCPYTLFPVRSYTYTHIHIYTYTHIHTYENNIDGERGGE